MEFMVVGEKSPLHSEPLNERYRLWLLKNSIFFKTARIWGDRKCLGKLRKSFVEHPDTILFSRISRERVFQHPRLFSTVSFRFARHPPTISKHYATHATNLAAHIRDALPRRFPELAVFDARLYIRVRRID